MKNIDVTGGIIATIDPDGKVRLQIVNNDSPGHFELLKPFALVLADGDLKRIHAHAHDHGDGKVHTHLGGGLEHKHV